MDVEEVMLHGFSCAGAALFSEVSMKPFRIGLAVMSVLWAAGQDSSAQTRLLPAWTTEGNQVFAGFGISVSSAGDVNRDGYADVIVVSPGFDGGQNNEGRAYVYHGSKNGLT